MSWTFHFPTRPPIPKDWTRCYCTITRQHSLCVLCTLKQFTMTNWNIITCCISPSILKAKETLLKGSKTENTVQCFWPNRVCFGKCLFRWVIVLHCSKRGGGVKWRNIWWSPWCQKSCNCLQEVSRNAEMTWNMYMVLYTGCVCTECCVKSLSSCI